MQEQLFYRQSLHMSLTKWGKSKPSFWMSLLAVSWLLITQLVLQNCPDRFYLEMLQDYFKGALLISSPSTIFIIIFFLHVVAYIKVGGWPENQESNLTFIIISPLLAKKCFINP